MVINTNISAQSSARLLLESNQLLSKSLSRLSSGSKIISPEDDVAGQAVSFRFDAQVSRINATKNNVSNAISFAQTQDGFLKKVSKALDRMSELAVLAQDITKTSADRDLYDKEFNTLGAYIDDLATKDFNGVSLFDNTALQVTVDSDAKTFEMAGIDLAASTSYTDATSATLAGADTSNAVDALEKVKLAITQLATDRATVGASVSALNSYNEQLGVLKDNITAANSRIKDVDVAEESTAYARYNILVQAGTAMLAQANALPQGVLRLLS
ncbi:MAG TPA: flagellin [Verrucomicrobiae bacterium]